MILSTIDWVIIGVFFLIVLSIGWIASKTAGKSTDEFFLGGRSMPWWLLGVSMVACTFSADTPNLVTGMVREDGVSKNWAWWAFLITGMVTVFIYAKLWRRSNVHTDLEFYELRYSGKAASFLRGFRSLYLGILFNCLIMGTVTLAAIKIAAVMFGLPPLVTVIGASVGVVIYASLGGIKGVIWADFFQYGIAMFGAVYAAYIAVQQPEIGSLTQLLDHPAVVDKLSFIPDLTNTSNLVTLLIIPIAVQWWAVWYPGAEPGGGGYIAQRMLSAKDEKNAIGATLFFNFAHYALRPWPWIIVALASLVIFPDLASIKAEFPQITDQYLGNDVAYPAMLTRLSPGWLGLVIASLIAAYMSTIGTHLNWGSSYIVNDYYKRFVKPDADQKELVLVGRISTVALMVITAIFALTILNNATQAFDLLLLSGAGTGSIYLLRWFWWRINAWTEIVAMIAATLNALVLVLIIPDAMLANEILDGFTMKLLLATGVTTIVWILATYLAPPEDMETLKKFYKQTHPGGPGWKRVKDALIAEGDTSIDHSKKWDLPHLILSVFVGCISIYSALFGIGSLVYGDVLQGLLLLLLFGGGLYLLFKLRTKLDIES